MAYGGGPYQDRIEARVRELQGPQTRAREQAEREIKEIIDRLKDTCTRNLQHFVNHTQIDDQGRIIQITANLLENIRFIDQIVAFLMDVFNLCHDRRPYKLVLQFGLLLHNIDTNEYRLWHINKHINTDRRHGLADATTMPNTWRIDDDGDEERVVQDMMTTNFWRLINADFHAYQYMQSPEKCQTFLRHPLHYS